MASSSEYLEFILEQLSGAEGVSSRAMMGEFIIYIRWRIAGGVYDDRFLVKSTAAARRLLPDAPLEEPYPGAKPMLLVQDIDNKALMAELLEAIYPELPEPRKKC